MKHCWLTLPPVLCLQVQRHNPDVTVTGPKHTLLTQRDPAEPSEPGSSPGVTQPSALCWMLTVGTVCFNGFLCPKVQFDPPSLGFAREHLAKGCPLRRGSATQPLETKATLVETKGHNGVAEWRPQVYWWWPTERKSWSWQPGLQRIIWLWTSRKLASYWHQEAPRPPLHQRRVCKDGPHLPLSQHPYLRSDNITAGIK